LGRRGPGRLCRGSWGTDQLEFVDASPAGANLVNLAGIASSFAPNYAPEEIIEIAQKLYKKAKDL
jgi:Mn-containing catalase